MAPSVSCLHKGGYSMINNKTRSQLKQEVKTVLRGNWGKAILLYLFILILLFLTGSYNSASNLMPNLANQNIFSSEIISLIISFITILIGLSANFRALDWLREPTLQFKPISSSFQLFKNPDWYRIIGIDIISTILVFLWSLLLIIPGIIKSLSYSQMYFIYKDLSDQGKAKDYSLIDYITQSRKLMNGHKMDYFILNLSFIGWFILAVITFGIGFIWLIPYYRMTMANFYRNLVDSQSQVI